MSKRLTHKQVERRNERRSMKAQRQRDHEKRRDEKTTKHRTVRGDGPRISPLAPKSRTRKRHRRNGAHLRVGGR